MKQKEGLRAVHLIRKRASFFSVFAFDPLAAGLLAFAGGREETLPDQMVAGYVSKAFLRQRPLGLYPASIYGKNIVK